MKIYVASSWRNMHQAHVVEALRDHGCEVYDFKNPPHGRGGFAWSQIDPAWQTWDPRGWRDGLKHPLAVEGFKSDLAGMEWADACVLVLPCGRSAHLEAGWFAGKGKPVAFLALEPCEPDLMVMLGGPVLASYEELGDWVFETSGKAVNDRRGQPWPVTADGVPVRLGMTVFAELLDDYDDDLDQGAVVTAMSDDGGGVVLTLRDTRGEKGPNFIDDVTPANVYSSREASLRARSTGPASGDTAVRA